MKPQRNGSHRRDPGLSATCMGEFAARQAAVERASEAYLMSHGLVPVRKRHAVQALAGVGEPVRDPSPPRTPETSG